MDAKGENGGGSGSTSAVVEEGIKNASSISGFLEQNGFPTILPR